MIPRMTIGHDNNETPAETLCKACGLCCTGHLFVWTKLRSPELDPIQSLGVKVFREPNQRGYSQPCPLWDGVCTIYDTPRYPRFCGTYKCKLLKQVMEDITPLPSALTTVRETKSLIHALGLILPITSSPNFRERLVECLENGIENPEILQKVNDLLDIYDKQFGVSDLLDS